MKKFDNHVNKLQREMIDITNNLNKFRNKNHKTISLIINNLNVLSYELANNNAEFDSNTSIKNSQNENSKASIEIYKENKKNSYSSFPKSNGINKRNRNNSELSEKSNDNYMTFFIKNKNNCTNKNNYNYSQTPRKQYFRINNIKYNKNDDYFNGVFDNELKPNQNNQTFNRTNNKNNIQNIYKNNNLSKQDHSKDRRNINNLVLKNENKYLRTELANKKKNNSITNLLFNNKKDFIYFNRNKQNYFKQNNQQNNTNKIQTCYNTQRNQDNRSQKNPRKINNFFEKNIIKNINKNESHDENKNNSFNDSTFYNLNNNIENENSKKHESENLEIKELLKLLKLNNNTDLKKKLKEFYTTTIFVNKVISIFFKNNKDRIKDEINLDEILYWILSISNYQKENEEYKKYCKQLMKNNNINNFNELKLFVDKILNKNIQNNNFIGGVKKILSTNIEDNSDFNFNDNINF